MLKVILCYIIVLFGKMCQLSQHPAQFQSSRHTHSNLDMSSCPESQQQLYKYPARILRAVNCPRPTNRFLDREWIHLLTEEVVCTNQPLPDSSY
jgi:hypothetical protein